MSHFKAALNLAGNDHLKKATADTRIGKLDFYGISGGTKEGGRRLFDDAEKALAPLKSSDMQLALAPSLGIRSLVECSVGEPAMGLQAKAKASALVDTIARDPAMSPVLLDSLRVGLVTGLSNTHCAQSVSRAQLGSSGAQAPPASGSRIDLSNQIMQLLVQGQYAALESRMNATVRSQVPLDRLQALWESLVPQIGPYKRTAGTETTSANNIPIYVVHGEFDKALVDLRLAFDGTNQLSYFLVTPRSALPKRDMEGKASAVASDFFGQKFNEVAAKFDANLAMQLPEGRLPGIWTQATNATGSFVKTTSAVRNNDFDFVDVVCEMQAGKLVVRVGYDLDMKINAFVIAPSK